jgi:hypothetical protein
MDDVNARDEQNGTDTISKSIIRFHVTQNRKKFSTVEEFDTRALTDSQFNSLGSLNASFKHKNLQDI